MFHNPFHFFIYIFSISTLRPKWKYRLKHSKTPIEAGILFCSFQGGIYTVLVVSIVNIDWYGMVLTILCGTIK